MNTPLEIVKKLTCSECDKFLVTPVKVYPNRTVKCGRCSTAGDHGAESHLYDLITKDMKFPCVNYLEGCNKILKQSEISDHEKQCCKIQPQYACPFCQYESSPYHLSVHLERHHSKAVLSNPEFTIKIDEAVILNEYVFVYYEGSKLLFVYYFLNKSLCNLNIALSCFGQENVKFDLKLCSFDGETKFEVKEQRCSKYGLMSSRDFMNFPIMPADFLHCVISCKFQVIDEVYFHLTAPKVNNEILYLSTNTAIIQCAFKMSQFSPGQTSKSNTYKIGQYSWNIQLHSYTDSIMFSLYAADWKRYACNVIFKVKLLSSKHGMTLAKCTEINFEDPTVYGFIMFERRPINNLNNGYLKGDSIRIEALIDVEP